MRTLVLILALLTFSQGKSVGETVKDDTKEPISFFQLKQEYKVWEPISFTVQNNTAAELRCNIAIEWLIDGKRTGAEIPDIAMKTPSKMAHIWVVKPKSSVRATWDPKNTPKIYYEGHKGEGRFVIVCREPLDGMARMFKLRSNIFLIK